jgi:hypothetical protein
MPVGPSSRLWAVTSYFNPAGYRRRRDNYRVFRDRLALPLATIELSFSGRFVLGPQDAELLIQIHGRDVLWQKERLLNWAIDALPAHCTQVALLDCDVVFVRPDWAAALSRRLDEVPLVQPFGTVHYPPPDVPCDSPLALAGDYTRPSVGSLVEQGLPMGPVLRHFPARLPGIRSPGHALAARRDLLQEHGLFDAAIVGGGDGLLLAAALGHVHELIQVHVMNEAYAACYLAWSERFRRDVQGELGSVPGDLVHLWHGTMEDRRSPQRYHDLATFDYNPAEDIALDASGCWRWNSDKPAMHAYVRDYFDIRNEDGRDQVEAHPPQRAHGAVRSAQPSWALGARP